MKKISVITTAFNEEVNINALVSRTFAVLESLSGYDYEFVIVDNGSTDKTSDEVRVQIKNGKNIKLVILSRNFGYQGGIDAGICHSTGDWAFVIDADLQDPPELLPEMLLKAEKEDLDVVYGLRKSREETIFRKFCYWLFYRIWRMTANIPVVVDSGDCCLISRQALDIIISMPERIRFFRGQRLWIGFKHGGIEYHRADREKGKTKFNLLSAIGLAFDGIYSYSFFPIRLITIIGVSVLTLLFGVLGLYVLGRLLVLLTGSSYFFPLLPDGLTVVQLFFAVFFGVNFILLGFVGEYVARIYDEVRARPRFLVRKIEELKLKK